MNSPEGPSFRFDEDSIHLAALQAQVLARCKGVLNHDLRNAVQGIHAGIELIARTTNPAVAAKVSPGECIAMLKEQLVNLQSTLERMISDTTLGAEKPVRFDLRELLNNSIRLLRHEPGITQARVDAPPHAYVLARQGLVRTVLMALLFDAADHVRAGGSIAIEVRTEEHVGLRIVVEGSSAAVAHAATLYQIANSILQREEGAVVHEADGVRRTVVLTLKTAQLIADETPATGRPALRALVADTHRDAADTLAMLLQIEGCDTRVSYDAASALHSAREFRPNLVLIDSGLTDCTPEQLHKASPSSQLKIIEMSYGANAVHVGVDGHIKKPIESRALKGVLAVARNA
jgi:CheY-like chemotaxis protein